MEKAFQIEITYSIWCGLLTPKYLRIWVSVAVSIVSVHRTVNINYVEAPTKLYLHIPYCIELLTKAFASCDGRMTLYMKAVGFLCR